MCLFVSTYMPIHVYFPQATHYPLSTCLHVSSLQHLQTSLTSQPCEQAALPKRLWYWSEPLSINGSNFTVHAASICLNGSYIRVITENAVSWSRCCVYYVMVSHWFLGRQHVITSRWCWVCCCLYGDHGACVVIIKCYDRAVCICIVWMEGWKNQMFCSKIFQEKHSEMHMNTVVSSSIIRCLSCKPDSAY